MWVGDNDSAFPQAPSCMRLELLGTTKLMITPSFDIPLGIARKVLETEHAN
jgi:hypothetical protein